CCVCCARSRADGRFCKSLHGTSSAPFGPPAASGSASRNEGRRGMATVPGPNRDKPLPRPGAPAQEPPYEPEEEPDVVGPERPDSPDWLPKPYDPEREVAEPGIPIGVEP